MTFYDEDKTLCNRISISRHVNNNTMASYVHTIYFNFIQCILLQGTMSSEEVEQAMLKKDDGP